MFDALTDRLGSILDSLTRRGVLSETDVNEAMREVRVALLEADVALPVVREFVEKTRAAASGQKVLRSVVPGQMVVKIVHDALIEMLGGGGAELNLAANPPVPIMIVGLQGSGKTTTTAKIARRLQKHDKKRVMMVSVDIYRPAAIEQLLILGKQADVVTLPIIQGEQPLQIASRAMDQARRGGFDVLLLDTAGRQTLDEAMMAEVMALRDAVVPAETLLVTDAMIGQDAVTTAEEFHTKLGVTGIVLTRVDGDARGGAALSMRAVTGCPIKLMGVGEKVEDLEIFHPERIASRILGMGDVVSLVEKATENIQNVEAEKLSARMMAGKFDLEDMLSQLRQIQKMGGMKGMLGLLPGISKMAKQLDRADIDPKAMGRQEAIILSMTPRERRTPAVVKASRKKRIAAGSGSSVQDVNRLLKQYQQMAAVMKKIKKGGMGGLGNKLSGGLHRQLHSGGLPLGLNQIKGK